MTAQVRPSAAGYPGSVNRAPCLYLDSTAAPVVLSVTSHRMLPFVADPVTVSSAKETS